MATRTATLPAPAQHKESSEIFRRRRSSDRGIHFSLCVFRSENPVATEEGRGPPHRTDQTFV